MGQRYVYHPAWSESRDLKRLKDEKQLRDGLDWSLASPAIINVQLWLFLRVPFEHQP